MELFFNIANLETFKLYEYSLEWKDVFMEMMS